MKYLIIVSLALLLSGCGSIQQAYDFGMSHCEYEKRDGKRVLTCAL